MHFCTPPVPLHLSSVVTNWQRCTAAALEHYICADSRVYGEDTQVSIPLYCTTVITILFGTPSVVPASVISFGAFAIWLYIIDFSMCKLDQFSKLNIAFCLKLLVLINRARWLLYVSYQFLHEELYLSSLKSLPARGTATAMSSKTYSES